MTKKNRGDKGEKECGYSESKNESVSWKKGRGMCPTELVRVRVRV